MSRVTAYKSRLSLTFFIIILLAHLMNSEARNPHIIDHIKAPPPPIVAVDNIKAPPPPTTTDNIKAPPPPVIWIKNFIHMLKGDWHSTLTVFGFHHLLLCIIFMLQCYLLDINLLDKKRKKKIVFEIFFNFVWKFLYKKDNGWYIMKIIRVSDKNSETLWGKCHSPLFYYYHERDPWSVNKN